MKGIDELLAAIGGLALLFAVIYYFVGYMIEYGWACKFCF